MNTKTLWRYIFVDNIREQHCDWLTVTSNEPMVMSGLNQVWFEVCRAALTDGGIITAGKWLGYDGSIVNGQFCGSRPDGVILKLTGKYAAEYAQHALRTGAHCTRVDFCVTEQLPEYDALYGEMLRGEAKDNRATMKGRNWPKIKRRDEDGDGDTITVGARSSDKYGRIYDKQEESGDDLYVRCWRWEVEYKGPEAVYYADKLRTANDTSGLAGAIVCSQYTEWGFCAPIAGYVAVDLFRASPVASDQNKTLDWLSIQVAPSVRKLTDNGVPRETLLTLLGLS